MNKLAADVPDPKDIRRVPKPLMEKRRRDRINHSLETLRVLLLENTHNEKLKNPKVEKAEILESVVHFLRAEQESGPQHLSLKGRKRNRTEDHEQELRSPCKRRQSYQDGMRTCLLRVSHFIASKGQELEEGVKNSSGGFQQSTLEHSACTNGDTSCVSSPYEGDLHPVQQLVTHIQPANPSAAQRQPMLSPGTPLCYPPISTKMGIIPNPSLVLKDSVWRPWPQ
ncbi:hairy-related 5 [Chanos chanos]|uniref:Hairy-related 5 n=1 Tax=Chanos chanos TaxID=29144 RepID=A0A6J2UMW3_CHACN|nr:transcription factor HES-7-like [Chanos chanos]